MKALQKFLVEAKEFATNEANQYGLPTVFHLELSVTKGQELAAKVGADPEIVTVGTYLMDCMLGQAFKAGKKDEHVAWSVEKTKELLTNFNLPEEIHENIIQCVAQHHGSDSFYSVEAEVCCNADCYRFVSIDGVLGGIHHSRKMELVDLKKLYKFKAEEKWQALTLKEAKVELEQEYNIIRKLF